MNLSPESIRFPRPVSSRCSSAEFMKLISETSAASAAPSFWFLGQSGWIVKDPSGLLLAADPYLTDFCASGRSGNPTEKSRLLPVFIEPEDFRADIVLLTHSHCDHTDPFTWERYPAGKAETTRFLAPWDASAVLRKSGIPENRISIMHPGEAREEAGLLITALFAEPTDATDLNHLGFHVRFSNGFTWYNTGDTAASPLLARQIRDRFPEPPDVMTVCINGGYNNLGHYEAARLVAEVAPRTAVPVHFDMMPHNLQMPHIFAYDLQKLAPRVRCVIPSYYEALPS